MGAAGSTANSCSSLDMRRQRQQLASQAIKQPLKYRQLDITRQHNRLSLSQHNKAASQMRHSNSYFELSQQQFQPPHSPQHPQPQPASSGQLYSSRDSNLKPSMLLAATKTSGAAYPQPVACRRPAAGVASRIQRKWQPTATRELKKLSDSLPSLNQLSESFQQPPYYSNHRTASPQGQLQRLARPQEQRKSVKLNQQQPKYQLVNGNNEPPQQSRHRQPCGGPNGYRASHLSAEQHYQQQHMKRATSLSALHSQGLVSYYGAQETELPNNRCPLAGPHEQKHLAYKQHPAPQLDRCQHHEPPPVSSSQMGKRFSKLKQAVVGSHHLPSKKYKPKQARHSPVQGCPVLPPLPRSQSLHEIIRLRSTENGQRMRNTGTLRGGPEGGAPGSRVNLVVELLESRRKEKRQAAATMLSRSSSFDDGIHDISVDQSGAEDSSGQSSAASISVAQQAPDAAAHPSAAATNESPKHRVYKKNGELPVAPTHKRFGASQQPKGSSQHRSSLTGGLPGMLEGSTSQSHEKEPLRKQREPATDGKVHLKRASSHSVLHHQHQHQHQESLDADESDDLNELARFLYQFKQRQATKSASTALAGSCSGGPGGQAEPPNSSTAHTTTPTKLGQQQQTSLQQQSPNSTTSSSGFASSICTTSNSISSSNGSAVRHPQEDLDDAARLKKPTTSQKKFTTSSNGPAPDETTACNRSASYDKQALAKGQSPLISGKLKLSSSLLSIVDEYNSNSARTRDHISPTRIHCVAPSATKLESLLLGGGDGSADASGSAEPRAESSEDEHDAEEQYLKLEELQRYTRLRQLSQSELALNHLISSSQLSAKHSRRQSSDRRLSNNSKGSSNSNHKKPQYKSKLFGLIKRASGERPPEVENSGPLESDYVQKHARLCSAGGPADWPLAANQASDRTTANQRRKSIDQTGALYLNEFGQPAGKSGLGATGSGHNKSSSAAKGWPSDGVCDLNFDCDYELIKNCGRAPASGAGRPPGSSLAKAANQNSTSGATGKASAANHWPRGTARKRHLIGACVSDRHRREHQHQQQTNWRLATSISLEKADRKACRSTCSTGGDKLRQPAEPCKLAQGPAPMPIKLKWSASGWLMGNRHSNKCAQCSSPSPKQLSSKPSRLPKLMWQPASNGTPHNDAPGCNKCPPCACCRSHKRSRRRARAANQLPKDTNTAESHQLEQQSITCPHGVCLDSLDAGSAADIMPLSGPLCRYYLSGGESGDDDEDEEEEEDDDDEEDEDAYASLNRAMIKATFDVSSANHSGQIDGNSSGSSGAPAADTRLNGKLFIHEPGSLSDSFTFSASGGSPVMAAAVAPASQLDASAKLATKVVQKRPLADSGQRLSQQPQCRTEPAKLLDHHLTATVNLNDNFILKRKTPNAGLKS